MQAEEDYKKHYGELKSFLEGDYTINLKTSDKGAFAVRKLKQGHKLADLQSLYNDNAKLQMLVDNLNNRHYPQTKDLTITQIKKDIVNICSNGKLEAVEDTRINPLTNNVISRGIENELACPSSNRAKQYALWGGCALSCLLTIGMLIDLSIEHPHFAKPTAFISMFLLPMAGYSIRRMCLEHDNIERNERNITDRPAALRVRNTNNHTPDIESGTRIELARENPREEEAAENPNTPQSFIEMTIMNQHNCDYSI